MNCHYCNKTTGLRPYGPNHSMVCFQCATATPERNMEACVNFGSQLAAVRGMAIIDGSAAGPYPLKHNPKASRAIERAHGFTGETE